jgi:hypothetical protein
VKAYLRSLTEPKFMSTAGRVALLVGSLLFLINHSPALVQGQMTRSRWASAALTYLVPYAVSVHGQHSSARRRRD